ARRGVAAGAAGVHGAGLGRAAGRGPVGRAAAAGDLAWRGNHHRERPVPVPPRARARNRQRGRSGGAVALLAGLAEEGPPSGAAELLAVGQAGAVARAVGLRVHLVVLLERERLLPLEEVEAVLAGLLHQLALLSRRQRADLALRVRADPPEHLVLDDVADPGEPFLVEQRVGRDHVRALAQALARPGRVPGVGHHVQRPIVVVVQFAFEELHRAGVEVEPAVVELQREPRRAAWLGVVDARAAEQQEVHAQREAVERQQEVLASTADVAHHQSLHARDVLAAVAGDPAHGLDGELRRLLLEDDDGRALGHARRLAAHATRAREPGGALRSGRRRPGPGSP